MSPKTEPNVAERIEALLARCDRLKRASDLDRPVLFDAAGQRHAATVAARDEQARGEVSFQER